MADVGHWGQWFASTVVYHTPLAVNIRISLWCCWASPPLDNIRVMVIVWRLRGNIIRTALCWIVWHNVHSLQHTYMSSSYRSNRLGLSHWDPYTVRRGGCLELYYCNMVEWYWWDSSLISTTNWFPSVLGHCWFGHLACKNRPRYDLLCVEWDVKPYTVHTHTPSSWRSSTRPISSNHSQHHCLHQLLIFHSADRCVPTVLASAFWRCTCLPEM